MVTEKEIGCHLQFYQKNKIIRQGEIEDYIKNIINMLKIYSIPIKKHFNEYLL